MDNNMEEKTYNGWTNYETWAVGLWIDNEQGSHTHWREQASQHFEEAAEEETPHESLWSQRSAARSKLAEQVQEEFEEASPLADQASVYSDLLNAALGDVDWHAIADHLLADAVDELGKREEEDAPMEVIYAYTRAQAIDDGVLIDVSAIAKEAGFKYPVALTSTVWADYVRVPEDAECQDEQGRLWDILNMLCFAIHKDGSGSEVSFSLYVNNDKKPEPVYLKSICGPGDDAKPVITIMQPHED